MSTMKPQCAKIIRHDAGMGTPTAETVRQRAIELARINGHRDFSADDWQQAREELHGGHEALDGNGATDITAMVSGHDMVVGSVGHHTENLGPEDADNIVEELISEGMDEALHEQMLAASLPVDAED